MKKIKELETELQDLMSKRPAHTKNAKYHRFQNYEHKVTFSDLRQTLQMSKWCNDHCQDDYSIDAATADGNVMSFKSQDDALLFKLTWGGKI